MNDFLNRDCNGLQTTESFHGYGCSFNSSPLVPHICVSELGQHWSALAYSAPSHYLNECWVIVNWTIGNKLQRFFLSNHKTFHSRKCTCKYRLRNGRPFCPRGDDLILMLMYHLFSSWLHLICHRVYIFLINLLIFKLSVHVFAQRIKFHFHW